MEQVIRRPHLREKINSRPLAVDHAPRAIQRNEDIVAINPQPGNAYQRGDETHQSKRSPQSPVCPAILAQPDPPPGEPRALPLHIDFKCLCCTSSTSSL